MSMVAMAHPVSHAPFKREFGWSDPRPSDYAYSRPRAEPERVALPSIRQAFPELHLRITPPDSTSRTASSATSPIVAPRDAMTPPEYTYSPNQPSKRRRLSLEDEQEVERARQRPRLIIGPSLEPHRQLSPTLAPRSATDTWGSSRASPYLGATGSLPSMRSPVVMDAEERLESRPILPSLPMLSFDRPAPIDPRARGRSLDDYPPESPTVRTVLVHPNGQIMEAAHDAYRPSYSFPYHGASRGHSLSMGAIHPAERIPFPGGYGGGAGSYQEYMRMSELSGLGHGDSKQRKRRGNLPKETTDKLRAWFVTHLHHPYPTEDEKQELMRQTGLQMNQISNWFINARRRQLPSMINNARAEADMLSVGRGVDGKIMPSTERHEHYHHHSHHQHHHDDARSAHLSDGEIGRYDDDRLESLERRRAANLDRDSI